jgi:hypothetical protein
MMKSVARILDASPWANRAINGRLTALVLGRLFSAPPIIIGGCPRSGTTLLLSILGSHPSILAIDYETTAFHPSFRPLRLLNGVRYRANNERVRRSREITRFCEKTPGNIRHVDEINDFFDGEVRFINILRDGRDVVTSFDPQDRSRYLVPPEVWVWDAKNALTAEERENVMTIKYESLVQDAEATLRVVCDFLAEPFVETMTAYHRSTNVTEALAWEGRARPIDPSSLRKWERPEHQDRLREFMSNPAAVELLRRLGYV